MVTLSIHALSHTIILKLSLSIILKLYKIFLWVKDRVGFSMSCRVTVIVLRLLGHMSSRFAATA